MKIYIGSNDAPLERQFKRGFDIVVGVQKTLAHYVRLLEDVQVAISISDVGAAWQNSYDERLIRTIKEAEVYLSDYRTYHDAYQ